MKNQKQKPKKERSLCDACAFKNECGDHSRTGSVVNLCEKYAHESELDKPITWELNFPAGISTK